jgi:hypothetical protein
MAAPAAGLSSAPAPVVAAPAPSGGGSSNTGFGLVALLGAGGIAVLRARQLSSAAGVDDVGTLTALGHSAATFWAGSCSSLGTGSSTSLGAANASFAAGMPESALGSRAQFDVKGVVAGPFDAAGSRISPDVASLAPGPGGSDRTGLVAALFAASAIIGGALGALGGRHRTTA